jgi:CobQ-like glutamine amidotransferase family enzyme
VNLDEKDWPSKAMGYQNSRSQTLALQVKGSVLFTLLHGPFLAKNPEWANELLARLGVEFESNRALLEVDGYVAEIWKLESN